jgi:diacylglycerol kinase family enzyme
MTLYFKPQRSSTGDQDQTHWRWSFTSESVQEERQRLKSLFGEGDSATPGDQQGKNEKQSHIRTTPKETEEPHPREIANREETPTEEGDVPSPVQKLTCSCVAEGYPMSYDQLLQYLPHSFLPPPPYHLKQILLKSVLVIYNPHAGDKQGTMIAKKVAQIINETHGIKVKLIPTQHKGHAIEICETMDVRDCNAILCVGGDGTFYECLNGWMRRLTKLLGSSGDGIERDGIFDMPFAVIPAGTGNAFAREIYGDTTLQTAVDHFLKGVTTLMDIVELYFPEAHDVYYSFNSLHWGLAPRVNVLAEKLRWLGKPLRYTSASLFELVEGIKTLPHRTVELEIENADGSLDHLVEQFSLVMANNIVMGTKGMLIAPCSKLNDGLMDVILVRTRSRWKLLKIFLHMFRGGSHIRLPYVEYRQSRSARWRILEDTSKGKGNRHMMNIDGDLLDITHFTAGQWTVIPHALRVIV